MLLNKSMHLKGEKCPGGKLSKERLTVLMTVFADGKILTLLLIGKSKNPRCFKNLKKKKLPVQYYANSKAWMTGQIFTEYLENLNQQMLREGRKILLFLDNASSHPKRKFSNIELMFFPPNCTSRLQPLDAGVIHTLKVYYRQAMLRKVLVLMNTNENASAVSSKVNILDAIMMNSRAAKRITPDCVKKCFKNCGFPIENQFESSSEISENELVELQHLLDRFETEDNVTTMTVDYLNIDKEIGTENDLVNFEFLIQQESNKNVIEIDEEIGSDDDFDIDEVDPISLPNVNDITESLNKLKIFSKIKGNHLLFENIENIESEINEEILKALPKKQSKIEDYFGL